ncbi:hypothetical protein [Agrobacterium sp. NPDC089420]
MLDGIEFGSLIVDKASIVADLNARGAKIVISQNPRRARPMQFDREL